MVVHSLWGASVQSRCFVYWRHHAAIVKLGSILPLSQGQEQYGSIGCHQFMNRRTNEIQGRFQVGGLHEVTGERKKAPQGGHADIVRTRHAWLLLKQPELKSPGTDAESPKSMRKSGPASTRNSRRSGHSARCHSLDDVASDRTILVARQGGTLHSLVYLTPE